MLWLEERFGHDRCLQTVERVYWMYLWAYCSLLGGKEENWVLRTFQHQEIYSKILNHKMVNLILKRYGQRVGKTRKKYF
jgi:hypothetical protein